MALKTGSTKALSPLCSVFRHLHSYVFNNVDKVFIKYFCDFVFIRYYLLIFNKSNFSSFFDFTEKHGFTVFQNLLLSGRKDLDFAFGFLPSFLFFFFLQKNWVLLERRLRYNSFVNTILRERRAIFHFFSHFLWSPTQSKCCPSRNRPDWNTRRHSIG